MTKKSFLSQLKAALVGLPEASVADTLSFYSEMIDDRIEDGLSEEEAVASVGPIEAIVRQVAENLGATPNPTKNHRTKRKLAPWKIGFLILLAPLWFSLMISAFALVFSLYGATWAVIISLWSVFVSVVCAGFGCIAGGVYFAFTGHILTGLVCIAGGLVCAGLSVFLFYGCKYITSKSIHITQKLFQWVKSLFTVKEVV